MKKVFAALLCLALMCGGAYGAYHDGSNDGNSWDTAYVIATLDDLTLMKERVNDGTESAGKYYRLDADINLASATSWEGIGSGDYFSGHFDGQNHTITLGSGASLFFEVSADAGTIAVRNLNISGSASGCSLATYLNSGIIENCSLADMKVTSSDFFTGGLVAQMDGGTVRNCTVSADIFSDNGRAGGIVGVMNDGVIDGCTIQAGTTITESSDTGSAGGIAGSFWGGTIENCTVEDGTVITAYETGGIAGRASLTPDTITMSGNSWPSQYTQSGNDASPVPEPDTPESSPTSPDVPDTNIENNTYSMVYNSHKYTLFELSMTWDEAEDYCEELGGHLVTIANQYEQDEIESLMASGDKRAYWLGGHKNDSGAWYWVDGTVWGYTHWGEGSGRDGDDENYCLIMIAETNPGSPVEVGTWFDVGNDGSSSYGFICEWDPVEAEFAPLNTEYQKWLEDPSAYLDNEEFYGELPDPFDTAHLAGNPASSSSLEGSFRTSATPPAVYDPRNSGKLSAVRDQGSYGTCWSFSSLGAMETNYLAQNLGTVAPDLSELHQAWFAYKDPRPGYAFDTIRVSSGKDPVLDQGGTLTMSLAFLARAGTANESELPYTQAANAESLTAGKLPEDYSSPLRLKDVYIIGDINAGNREEVKQLIMTHGAVRVSIIYSGEGMTGNTYYYNGDGGGGHAVVIVGWDDSMETSGGRGAWLVRNSWGTARHDGGYFWMSYNQAVSSAAVFVCGNTTQGLYYKGYDWLGATDAINYHWSANIFQASGNETLHEVAFHTHDNNVSYEVYVNKHGKTRPQNPGVPETLVAQGTMPYAGYHSLSLNSTVNIEDGEYFSVIVKLSGRSGYSYYTPVEDADTFRASSVGTGESYFSASEEIPDESDWRDGITVRDNGAGRACSACIKVFTSQAGVTPAPAPAPTPTQEDPTPTPAPTPTPTPETTPTQSSSGGGGCNASTMAAMFGALLLAFTVSRKK